MNNYKERTVSYCKLNINQRINFRSYFWAKYNPDWDKHPMEVIMVMMREDDWRSPFTSIYNYPESIRELTMSQMLSKSYKKIEKEYNERQQAKVMNEVNKILSL